MAMKRLDLIGIRFGKLVVIDLAPYRLEKDGRKRIMWLCKCDCGELVSKSSENLKENGQLVADVQRGSIQHILPMLKECI